MTLFIQETGKVCPAGLKPDIQHLIERLHTQHALRFLDLEITGGEEIMPGVWCEPAYAHTEGSMNVVVETADGLANICGDVIYDFQDQIIEPVHQSQFMEPQVTGNHAGSKRAEKGAIKKLLNKVGSISVPLTAIFPAERPREPIILRDIFTKATLLEK